MYTRPEFTKIVGSTLNQIRYYEQRGILVPDDIDKKTHCHYYSENAVQVFQQIQRLLSVGYSLDEIQFHLDGSDGLSDEEFFYKREKALCEQLESLRIMRGEEIVEQIKAKRHYRKPMAKIEKDK